MQEREKNLMPISEPPNCLCGAVRSPLLCALNARNKHARNTHALSLTPVPFSHLHACYARASVCTLTHTDTHERARAQAPVKPSAFLSIGNTLQSEWWDECREFQLKREDKSQGDI